ncbi:hypothetical protein Tco_1069917 [Tanacetum coccineum]|uniref:Uncharacterized protein n=1 Tax=Tanacetum coccineum TaxID=301880 RepID=A0ABQ5HLT3_9ASTR
MANLDFCDKHNMVAFLKKPEGSEGFHQIVDFLSSTHIKYALTEYPTIYVSLIHQFWQTASASTSKNEKMEITATINGRVKSVTEASIRRHLKLEDSDGISTLPNTEIFEQLALIGFIQIFLNKHKRQLLPHKRTYTAPTLTQKLFDNMRRISKGYNKVDIPLFPTMLVQGPIFQGEGSTVLVESHHTPTSALSTSQPPTSPPSMQTTHVAEEAATMPHDSTLPRVHSLGSDESSMTLNELTVLCTTLSKKVESLESNLEQTKLTYGTAYTKLIMKVKKLENRIKSSKARRRFRLIVSEDEEIYTAEPDINTANVPVSTAGAEVSTANLKVKTAAERLVYIRRSAKKRKDKGKAIMKEAEPDNIQAQIKADEELAQKLQAEERGKFSKKLSFDEIKELFETTMKKVKDFVPMESDRLVLKISTGSSKRTAKTELDHWYGY